MRLLVVEDDERRAPTVTRGWRPASDAGGARSTIRRLAPRPAGPAADPSR
jgi:hypothetical protein